MERVAGTVAGGISQGAPLSFAVPFSCGYCWSMTCSPARFHPTFAHRSAVAILFIVSVVASLCVLADAAYGTVTLKSPTSDSRALKQRAEAKLIVTADKAGSLSIERQLAPYSGGWQPVATSNAQAGEPVTVKVSEQVNSLYRAVLQPSDGSPSQTSESAGVWRKWPKPTPTFKFARSTGTSTLTVKSSLPEVLLPGGQDLYGFDGTPVKLWVRFLKPSNLDKRYFKLSDTASLNLKGDRITYKVAYSVPTKAAWRSRLISCVVLKPEQKIFGAPLANECPTSDRLTLRQEAKMAKLQDASRSW